MKIIVLGCAAGGGSPQWNCRCDVCSLAWSGDPRVSRRTQASLAVSSDGTRWCLLNCSPDIREQIERTPGLQPRSGRRGSPIVDVVLTNADIDHIGGLLSLREGHAFTLHATAETLAILRRNAIFDVLPETTVIRRQLNIGDRQPIADGIDIECFMVPGKLPLYLEGEAPDTSLRSGNTVGVTVRSGKTAFHYIPGCARLDSETTARLDRAALVFFDGTLWTDDEMMTTGTGTKTGRRMGHMPVSGPDGSLAGLQPLGIKRLVYTHMNNTNPMLIEDSPQHRSVVAGGAEIARDGMEFTL